MRTVDISLRRSFIWMVSVVIFACLFLSGCSMKKVETTTAESYKVTDAIGEVVTIPHKPMRIMGTSPAIDTMLLGVVEPSRLVLCYDSDRDPVMSYISEDVKDIPVTVPFRGISMEIITRMKPDLIVASTYVKPKELELWKSMGYPVIVIRGPVSVSQVKDAVTLIAAAVGENDRGERVIGEMNRQLKEIDDTISKLDRPKPSVFLVSQMTKYGGPGSMYHELLTHAHIRNAIEEAGAVNGELLAQELLVKADPDFLIVSTDRAGDSTGAGAFRDKFLSNPAIQKMRASQHIIALDDKYIYASSQNCVFAIKALANAVYGHLFDLSDEKQIKGF